jgi:hypothetical protein
MPTVPVTYHMDNEVNGKLIQISGGGSLSEAGLSLDLAISDVPEDWTGVIVPCICSGPGPDKGGGGGRNSRVTSPGLMTISKRGYETSPGTFRVATLFDKEGNTVAAVKAIGRYEKNESSFDFKIKVNTQTKKDSVISRIANVDHYSFSIQPNGPGKVEVIAHYGLSTEDGEKVFGFTHIYYDLIEDNRTLAAPLMGHNKIVVDWRSNSLKYTTDQTTMPLGSIGQLWL